HSKLPLILLLKRAKSSPRLYDLTLSHFSCGLPAVRNRASGRRVMLLVENVPVGYAVAFLFTLPFSPIVARSFSKSKGEPLMKGSLDNSQPAPKDHNGTPF